MPRTSLRCEPTAAELALRCLVLAVTLSVGVVAAPILAAESWKPGCTRRPSEMARADVPITLSLKDVSLDSVFQNLGDTAGLTVRTSELGGRVSVEYVDRSAADVLEDLARRFNLVYVVNAPDSLLVQEVRLAGLNGVGYPEVTRSVLPTPGDGKKPVTGLAKLNVLVCADGSVGAVDVLAAKPSDFDLRAADAVRRWFYQPARDRTSATVPSHMATTIDSR